MTGSNTLEQPLPVEPPPAAAQSSSVTGLLSGIIDDLQKLVRQQLDMLKAEIKEDLSRTKRASEFGGIGIVLMTVGGLTLVAFLVNLLHEQFQFSMWGSCLIIGSILLGGGLACALTAWNLFERFNPMPDKTLKALRENLTWKTQPQT